MNNNEKLELIIIGIFIVFVLVIFILLIIVSSLEKSKIKYYNLIKSIMRIILPSISLTFFGQIFELFILIFKCDEKCGVAGCNSFKCPNNGLFYIFSVFCIIAIILLLFISYITISAYYKPNFIKERNNSLNKIDAFPNKIFFFTKVLFIVLTNIKYNNQIFIWIILIILLIASSMNMLGFTKYNNYKNKLLLEINKFFSILLFWIIFCLIIGKIFISLDFDGTLYYFLFGIIISIISAIIYKDRLNSFSFINFNELNSSYERLKFIQKFIELVQKKHLTREKSLLFDSLILIQEENCINKNCKLKKYLKSLKRGEAKDFILFQHCQTLYEKALRKFPDDYKLKINYIVYLIVQMSKRKLAEKVLYTMKFEPFHFEKNYMIYCCKRFSESYNSSLEEEIYKIKNINIMKKIEYEKLNEEFKNDLIKASSLYHDFWNALNKYHMQRIENFEKINYIGKEINNLINDIEQKFNILHNIKGDDANLLHIYSEFIKYILDDKTKYNNLKKILISISNIDKIKDFEIDYTNFDYKYFDGTDEFKYIIISAEEEHFGTILNISHNASKILGYTKQELIGEKFWKLLPCICRKEFENYLIKHTNKLKTKFYEALTNKKEYIPQFEELFINARDKSKYLIQLHIKMFLVQTEENEHAYIITMSYLEDINLNKIKDIFKIGSIFDQNKNKEEKLYKYCIVLTDNNFIIQTFTSNCQEHLGLNTHIMNSNIDLTQFIPEFNDSVNDLINEKRKKYENKTDKIIYKRYIAENNYSESKLISWKVEALENFLAKNKSNISNIDRTFKNNKISKNSVFYDIEKNSKEKLFLLIIKKEIFNNKHVGYIFLFRREQVNFFEKNTNEDKIKRNSFIMKLNNNNNKLLKPRRITFSSFKSSDNIDKKSQKRIKNEIKEKIEANIDKIKFSKSEKKIIKRPKSFDIKKNNNIVGIIEDKIENILKEDFPKKNLKPIENKINSFNYIPKSEFNFSLDINLMSFKPSYTINNNNILIEFLKEEAQKKINLQKNNKTMKEPNNSSYLYSSYEEENESSFEEQENNSSEISISNRNISTKVIETKKKENMKENLDQEYYRVRDLNKIKFMIFDFDQEIIINVDKIGHEENRSKVENIILNNKFNIPIILDKDGNDPSLMVNKFLSKYSSKNDKYKEKCSRKNFLISTKNVKKPIKQKEAFKKLESELNKKKKEKSIILYSILCLFLNLILLGMGGYSLYFVLNQLKTFRDNLLLIVYGALIRHYTNLGIYHTRMYTLTKIESEGKIYNNIVLDKNRTEYLEFVSNKLYDDFNKGSKFLEDLITINFKLSENNEKKLLYSQNFVNKIIGSGFKNKNVTSDYIVGITEIYSHFYYLVVNIEDKDLKYDSPESLNFIYNALNSAGKGLTEIIDVFIDEINHKKKAHIYSTYIILAVYLVLIIIMFFLVDINYHHIIARRDSYISTFYQINLSFIKSSLSKCEKFLNKLNQNKIISNEEKSKNKMDDSVSISNFDDNLLTDELINNNANNQGNRGKNECKRKRNKSLLATFISFLLLIYLIMAIPLIEFNKYISKFEIMSLYMYHMLHFHNNIINIYNSYNEYLFYSDSRVENINVLTFLEKIINNTYDTSTEDINYLLINSKKIPGLNEVFTKIRNEKLCKKSNSCEYYIEIITSLGYYNFVYFFISEILTKINYATILYEKKYKKLWDQNIEIRLITLFNIIHYDVDFMFNFVILRYIEEELSLTVEKIFGNINSRNQMYIILYSIYLVAIILSYFFYWNPFITKTQDEIHKTKLTLNIIPSEILETQTNIKNILRISDLNE